MKAFFFILLFVAIGYAAKMFLFVPGAGEPSVRDKIAIATTPLPELVKQSVAKFNKNVPSQLDAVSSVTSFEAEGTKIIANIATSKNITRFQLEASYPKLTELSRGAVRADAEVKAFLERGGTIVHRYHLASGEKVFDIEFDAGDL